MADRLELARAGPDGPISLESGGCSRPASGFVDGWASRSLRTCDPADVIDRLDRLIPAQLSALERRLSSMRMAGLVEARQPRGQDSLRRHRLGAGACFRSRPRSTANGCICGGGRAGRSDRHQAAFMLATPCRTTERHKRLLPVRGGPGTRSLARAGRVAVAVEAGRVVACAESFRRTERDRHAPPHAGSARSRTGTANLLSSTFASALSEAGHRAALGPADP